MTPGDFGETHGDDVADCDARIIWRRHRAADTLHRCRLAAGFITRSVARLRRRRVTADRHLLLAGEDGKYTIAVDLSAISFHRRADDAKYFVDEE